MESRSWVYTHKAIQNQKQLSICLHFLRVKDYGISITETSVVPSSNHPIINHPVNSELNTNIKNNLKLKPKTELE